MTAADRTGRTSVRIHRMGTDALLVELPDLAAAMAVDAALRAAVVRGELPAPEDQIPAARTVLLRPRPGTEPAEYRLRVEMICTTSTVGITGDLDASDDGDAAETPEVVEIPVVYDGPDRAEVSRLTGLDPGEVVRAHTGTAWQVAFGGFAPGFGYLTGGDPRLTVPRRDTPRPRIPAGSVGLAGEFSGIYPRASPGGWQLIGRTDLSLWDLQRDPPAILRPGVVVRFRDLEGR